jgi:hypothetical protein
MRRLPRSICVTRPSNSELETMGSIRRARSPRVSRSGSRESPFVALEVTMPVTLCATSLPERAKATISPGAISFAVARSMVTRSPGLIAGTMLVPETRRRTLPALRTALATRLHADAFGALIRSDWVILTGDLPGQTSGSETSGKLPVLVTPRLGGVDLAASERGDLEDTLKAEGRRFVRLLLVDRFLRF